MHSVFVICIFHVIRKLCGKAKCKQVHASVEPFLPAFMSVCVCVCVCVCMVAESVSEISNLSRPHQSLCTFCALFLLEQAVLWWEKQQSFHLSLIKSIDGGVWCLLHSFHAHRHAAALTNTCSYAHTPTPSTLHHYQDYHTLADTPWNLIKIHTITLCVSVRVCLWVQCVGVRVCLCTCACVCVGCEWIFTR